MTTTTPKATTTTTTTTAVPALQPGEGPVRAPVYLSAEPPHVLWGRLPCASDTPVLTIDPGTEVTIDTISHEGLLEDQGRDPLAFFAGHGVEPDEVLADGIALAASRSPRDPDDDGPHVVTGPIAVRGAQPRDVLTMTVVETVPRVGYGVVSNRHGRGALPGELPEGPGTVSVFTRLAPDDGAPGAYRLSMPRGRDGRTVEFPAAPFLGIMGVATATEARAHSVPPGPHGGNVDIRLLTAGSALHLPVQVPGALAYVGDPHFAQGDGEVALTAVEGSLRATVRFDVMPAAIAEERFGRLDGPLVETPTHLVPTGLDEDLDEAVRQCVRHAIDLLTARFGFDRAHALAYLSASTDFDISQVVDRVKGVHARIAIAEVA
ncbi:Amidase [Luteimicrobium xylanilyticum]|uniref:Amidase n=1 Tax=Luteimicrobium xylanilyticum TaxID=1133546 RepID=A0A5P9QDV5_9MICO|nr:acetamidase/formamidase family protein [Luteimicrobium xylanilyticum]QFU99567.1 Amidase [Luteimicrobium xylanilyticum]